MAASAGGRTPPAAISPAEPSSPHFVEAIGVAAPIAFTVDYSKLRSADASITAPANTSNHNTVCRNCAALIPT